MLYGGRSGEHEVSLASAAAVWANLNRKLYEPVAVRIEKDGRWVLPDRPPSAASAAEVIEQARSEATRVRGGREVLLPPRPGGQTMVVLDRKAEDDDQSVAPALMGLGVDVVFPVLHGPLGEDGTIQGLLELANVAYVGCGVLASSAGMDKLVMKTLFRAEGLNVPNWVAVDRRAWQVNADALTARIGQELIYPLFVKPANMGSSVGISKVASPADLAGAISLAASFDRRIVVESAVPSAREIECAVLGNGTPEASVPGEIMPSREFYDYEAKYIDAGSTLQIPAAIPAELAQQIQSQSIRAVQAIDGAGLARVDFLINRTTGEVFINEINTMPGFTTISMYSKMWAASGVDYATLVDRLINLAIERHQEKQQQRTSLFG